MSFFDAQNEGNKAGEKSPMANAVNKIVQSGRMDSKTGADVLNGMMTGLLSEVFVPLTRALTWELVESEHGHHTFVVDLRNGDQIRIDIQG